MEDTPLLNNKTSFQKLFYGQKYTLIILYVWILILISIIFILGINKTDYINFGPSVEAKFISVPIDNWYKWFLIAFFMFFNTVINVFIIETVYPWIANTVQDHKNIYLPYNKKTCLFICQSYYLYNNIFYMFNIFGMFIQIDFLFIKMFADLLTSYFTTSQYLKYKEYDENKYFKWYDK